ncbi:MAG: acetone carboxylase subunit gamma [Syntrophales bacterium]
MKSEQSEVDISVVASKERIRLITEGKLPWELCQQMMRLEEKDEDRFLKYMEVLQERVPWKEKILCRMTEKLYVVRKDDGSRIVKCICGQEYGDYRINWKLSCRIRVRRSKEEWREVMSMEEVIPNPNLVESREYYCPGCFTRQGVEVVPVGYPAIFEILPDIDLVYRMHDKPLEDESPDWFQDKTADLTSKWAKEV